MKIRWILVAAALMISAAVFADEVSDALTKAQKFYGEKKYAEAKAEIEKALAAVTAKARASTPEPEVKDRTYTNYEFSFRVTRPAKDWDLALAKVSGPSAAGTVPFCQLSCTRSDIRGDDVVILYARDLRAFYGARYDTTVAGHEKEFLKIAGKQMASSVKQLTDVTVTGQTELTVSLSPAVRTDYTARKGEKAMKCFTVDILRGQYLFSALFIGNAANAAAVGPAFKEIFESIDLSPVAKEGHQ